MIDRLMKVSVVGASAAAVGFGLVALGCPWWITWPTVFVGIIGAVTAMSG